MTAFAARLVAFVLPQFHPIPENDRWWGTGFTEWTSVRRGRPLFPGHHQPHVPGELGYYDLLSPSIAPRMSALAASAGISAFCYYHYWFHGERLLAEPVDALLRTGEPAFPFCLCWANEPWSRRWDGSDDEVLQPQTYSARDDEAHIHALLPAFRDERALRVDDRPVFLVYRPSDLPDPRATAACWRAVAREGGLAGLHLIAVETGPGAGVDPRTVGFDASLRFQPDWHILNSAPQLELGPPTARVYDYEAVQPALATSAPVPWRRYETVCPGWDNTARRGERALVLHRPSPRVYERWLRAAIDEVQDEPADHRLVFLNAWNEWGEGCHLEPDRRFGRAFLRSTRRAVDARVAAG
jgi:lipopolysaccharide biosynthesis protein